MTVRDLFRILLDEEEVEIEFNKEIVWYGKVKDMPNCYFNSIVNLLYSVPYECESYIRIIIDDVE